VLIEAMNYLPKWRLDIAGRFLQSDYEMRCKQLAKPNKDRIYFHGFVNDKLGWMQKATVFVMPSRQEAWSTQVMEAMACECSVIAPEIGGEPQYVPEIELVSIDISPEQLAEKIIEVANDEELGVLYRNIVKKYDWAIVKKETENVLMRLRDNV